MLSRKLLVSAIAALVSAPAFVSADSDIGIGGAGTNASANVDFRIIIPQFIYFRVGSAAAGTIDRVAFDLGAGAGTQPGAGGTVAANAAAGLGDGTDGSLTVQVVTNVASLTIAATGGNLTDGTNNIPFTKINRTDGGVVPMPAFGASGPVGGLPGTLNDTWSYDYNNDTSYPPGTYNGTVVYTVTAP